MSTGSVEQPPPRRAALGDRLRIERGLGRCRLPNQASASAPGLGSALFCRRTAVMGGGPAGLAATGPAFEGHSPFRGAAPVRDPGAVQPLTHMAAGVRHEWLPPRCPPEAGGLSRQDWKTVGTASAELPRADVHPAPLQPRQSTLSGRSTTRLTVSGANALLAACERAS
jgi:hypothetical protein